MMKAKCRSGRARKKGGEQRQIAVAPPTVTHGSPEVENKPKGKRGVKTASDELKTLIRMANLAGNRDLKYDHFKNSAWQSTPGLLSAIMELDDPLRSHLLQVMNEPEREPWTTASMVEAGFKPEIAWVHCHAWAVSMRYHLIQGAQITLSRVVAGDEFFPAQTFMARRVDKNGKHKAYLNEIAQPLLEVDDLRDIRSCKVCNRFFFRRRKTSVVCDPDSPCAATYSKRQERDNAKTRAELAAKKAARKGSKSKAKKVKRSGLTPAPKR
jgi:hypothetical protein